MELTTEWNTLRPHPEQSAYASCTKRFVVAVAGRRSGKSVIMRRRRVLKGFAFSKATDGLGILCAPTRDQAKRLHWERIKRLVPRKYVALRNGKTPCISESELTLQLAHNGYTFAIVGLDKPQRAEGDTIDDAGMDEVADMRPTAWALSIRPSLSTEGREGTADFIGKPRGKGFYHSLWQRAATLDDWARFHWKARDILPAAEIEAVQRELSALEFRQEYEAEWVTFEGACYYPFDEDVHARIALQYDPDATLDFCFDFNVKPGTATVVQTQSITKMGYHLPSIFMDEVDAVIGEVYIPDNSNTRQVCDRIVDGWSKHQGEVRLFGDWSGGSRKTSSTEGSDWDQILKILGNVFGGRMTLMIRPPTSEVARINALNARILSAFDRARMVVDPFMCPNTVNDIISVTRLEDGRIDKNRDPMLTHLSDGLGDRARFLYPTTEHLVVNEPLLV